MVLERPRIQQGIAIGTSVLGSVDLFKGIYDGFTHGSLASLEQVSGFMLLNLGKVISPRTGTLDKIIAFGGIAGSAVAFETAIFVSALNDNAGSLISSFSWIPAAASLLTTQSIFRPTPRREDD